MRLVALPPCLLVLALAGACSRPQARTVPEMPALDMPPPPPRVVEAVLDSEPLDLPVEELPPGLPSRPRVEPAQRTEAPRAEPRNEPVASSGSAEAPRTPPTTLQIATPQREAQLERDVRAQLTLAASTLNRIDYQRLSVGARDQYDQARRFMSQAQEALQARNLPFAENLAGKAVTLASQLSGR
jgi:hypothetical protein